MTKFRSSGLIKVMLLLCFQTSFAQNKEVEIAEQAVKSLSDVMIHDITSPLVASRSYAYSLIAFYEASRLADARFLSYAGQLNGLKPLPEPSGNLQYDWFLAGITAFYKTSYSFVFSKDIFQKSWKPIEAQLKKRRVSAESYDRSVKFGESIADHILGWSREDNYLHTRTLPRFSPGKDPGAWKQTPPDYMEAIEPYWNQIRPMILSKPNEFLLSPPEPYNSKKFLEECREVYETGLNLTKAQSDAANFWDCNPFATQTVGHLVYSIKKISPGGHWIGITGAIIKLKKQNLQEALLSYSLVSVAIFDAFIATWDEKYRSNYIRPVTAIQQLISPIWQPLLQTPPFPEYPSGHSVISTAAAGILTHIYGDNLRYIDYVEKPYGIPERAFASFYEAANEAALSRLYGGIHFRQAVENGKELGRKVSKKVLEKVQLVR